MKKIWIVAVFAKNGKERAEYEPAWCGVNVLNHFREKHMKNVYITRTKKEAKELVDSLNECAREMDMYLKFSEMWGDDDED